MKRKIVTTADGSTSILLPEWQEQYHSKHGAIQEANHVFINAGLIHLLNKNNYKEISILEIGFGTGLNALLTLLKAEELKIKTNYVGVEGYPIETSEIKQLNYTNILKSKSLSNGIFNKMHQISWNKTHSISEYFNLKKEEKFFSEINYINTFNLIYFDAFGARVQPELWTMPIFKTMYKALKKKGVLVTYSAKGSAKRAMQEVGFTVEKIEGPPGKREMLRAIKNEI